MLIFDNHVTHTKNVAATDMARDAGVVMVSLLPHTTHRFQPLDGAFIGPLTTWQVAEILNVAYRKAASVQNAVSGFGKAGLWSLTIYVFQDSDFAAAMVTNVITEAARAQPYVTCDPSCCSSSTDSSCHGEYTKA